MGDAGHGRVCDIVDACVYCVCRDIHCMRIPEHDEDARKYGTCWGLCCTHELVSIKTTPHCRDDRIGNTRKWSCWWCLADLAASTSLSCRLILFETDTQTIRICDLNLLCQFSTSLKFPNNVTIHRIIWMKIEQCRMRIIAQSNASCFRSN